MDLPVVFALLAVLGIAIYVIADGFDLGVGLLFPLAPSEQERNVMMESIAPMWDGNETWLVFGGALLWAVFPIAYYVLLPAFYLPLMMMLFALVFRGVAFEFRFQATQFRRVWDYAFAGGSLLAVLAQGFVLGGFIGGVPVTNSAFSGGPFSWFTLLGLLCGAGLVGGYGLLGAGWLIWRTNGHTQIFGREVGRAALLLTVAGMLLVSAWTALTVPDVAERWFAWPWLLPLALLPLAAAGTALLIWRSLWSPREGRVFGLAVLLFLVGFAGLAVSLWPYVVPRHATIWSASADDSSLHFVGIGVIIVLPVILAYLGHAYWVFRGKTAAGYGNETATGTEVFTPTPRPSVRDTDLHFS
ncbi:MAG TPA: cytochrome d ubiquinol oxidase subunit II [Acidisoma sp.]|uniref:cytochrome d ubiquinol oxidase subunit II n=1 Tax=Acidisoma sp. TaxID=1872115 RepID=UPI002CC1830D|nr:cytochrome d ubiquinol oxidase subunit II [Acidisoma sp.]HTI00292.1 cytochrome d ubiquinol oxidase subunit II [Acidisoma sp.]